MTNEEYLEQHPELVMRYEALDPEFDFDGSLEEYVTGVREIEAAIQEWVKEQKEQKQCL